MRRIQAGLCFVLGCAVATGQAARAADLIGGNGVVETSSFFMLCSNAALN